MFFVYDDQSEVFDGRKDGRPGADDDASVAVFDACPLVESFAFLKRGMKDRDLVTEARAQSS